MMRFDYVTNVCSGQRSLAFAWPDPDTAEEQNLIDRLRDACRRPPPAATNTTQIPIIPVAATTTVDTAVIGSGVAVTTGPEHTTAIDVSDLGIALDTVVSATASSSSPSPSPTSSTYPDSSSSRNLGCIYPLGPHDIDPNNRQYQPTERSFPCSGHGTPGQHTTSSDTFRFGRGRGRGAVLGARARARGGIQVAQPRASSPVNEPTA